jgi:hypothetical protein
VPERVDNDSMPMTEPHAAPIFDTGPHPMPMAQREATKPQPVVNRNPWFDPMFATERAEPMPYGESTDNTDLLTATAAIEREPARQPAPAHPVAVPSQYQFLKAWKLLTVLSAVWLVAGAVGLGLYYWWFTSMDKTWVEVVVLLYTMISVVAALLLSLRDGKPVQSAAAIAVMTAPFASTMAAGALYGMFAVGWLSP